MFLFRIFFIFLLLTLTQSLATSVHGDTNYLEKTHEELNELGALLVKQADENLGIYAEIYDSSHIVKLRRGGYDEDASYYSSAPTECKDGRFMQHFYHPYTPQGVGNGLLPPSYTVGDARCMDAVTWARSSASDTEGKDSYGRKDDLTWVGAIKSYDYTLQSKLDAYERLGHVAHLVGDMAQPEHVHLEPHPPYLSLDPQGGYEKWVNNNFALVKPNITTLVPVNFSRMEDYLTDLAKISYDLSSFYGGELFKDNITPIDKTTPFSKMFNIQYVNAVKQEWFLFNNSNNALLGAYDGSYSVYDEGLQWWKTDQETGQGSSGYYYVEDIVNAIPSEFQGGSNTKLEHLGKLYADRLLPLAVTHIAGLYQHYYDIVNLPPYVYQVTVTQNGQCIYKQYWKDFLENSDFSKVARRELTPDCPTPGLINKQQGPVTVQVEFGSQSEGSAEKVKKESVKIELADDKGGICPISGDLDSSETIWTGTIDPANASCAIDGTITIQISAKDKNNHYVNRNYPGDELDSYPSIPAKVDDVVNYNWNAGYKPGIDRNHRLYVGVDTVLIIDSSGSMDTNDPSNSRISAAKAFVDSAQTGDRIAVISFSSGANILANLKLIQNPADKIFLKAVIDQVGAFGSTNINAALNAGFNLLLGSGGSNLKSAVLLTDGEHTDGPYDPHSHLQFQEKNWPIYTVALGGGISSASSSEFEGVTPNAPVVNLVQFLIDIAAQTGGGHFFASQPDELVKIYRSISGQTAGAFEITDTKVAISQSEAKQLAVDLSGKRKFVTFFANWSSDEIFMSLVDPTGRTIDSLTLDANIYHAKENIYEIYTIQSPESGQWHVNLSAKSTISATVNVNVSAVNTIVNRFLYMPLVYKQALLSNQPTATNTPTSAPATLTPISTNTSTSVATPMPTSTPSAIATETPVQTSTATATPIPPTATPTLSLLLAYASSKSGNSEIYQMHSDGSQQVNITNHPAYDWGPNWSPDGRQITFISSRDGNSEVYVMNEDGSNQHRLTNNAVYDAGPNWSPKGDWIAYKSLENNDYHIYLIKPDGSTQKPLTTNAADDWRISWSPDGTRLAFSSLRDGNAEIYLINMDGTGLLRLTTQPAQDNDVTWSPDGKKLAFVSTRDGNPEIYTMNIDGSQLMRLTNSAGADTIPSWSPDSQKLAFTSHRDGVDAVYIMNADGSAQTRITNDSNNNNFAVWRPN